MKDRPPPRWKHDVASPSAPLRYGGLRSAAGDARGGSEPTLRPGRLASVYKIVAPWRMTLLPLRGKIPLARITFPPKGYNSNESRHQVYRHGRAQGSDCDRGPEWQWEAGHGNHRRNQSQQPSRVPSRSTGRTPRDLGRRDLGGLVVRSAAAAGGAGSGLRSTPECLIKGGEQERQGGCAQAGRVATHRNAASGLSRRKWTTDAARIGPLLSDHQQ